AVTRVLFARTTKLSAPGVLLASRTATSQRENSHGPCASWVTCTRVPDRYPRPLSQLPGCLTRTVPASAGRARTVCGEAPRGTPAASRYPDPVRGSAE